MSEAAGAVGGTLALARSAGPARPLESPFAVELFRRVAAATPEAVAAVDAGGELTYGELDLLSNRVARHLRRNGVRRGDVVGVGMRRRAPLVAALLGVLKAGAAFLPLSPTDPPARTRSLRRDAGCRLVLCDLRTIDGLGPGRGASVALDHRAPALAAEDPASFELELEDDERAYVVYTSGSTGTPKGVEVPHRALANALAALRDELEIGAGDLVAHHTPLTFDIALFELLTPLVAGAAVLLVEPTLADEPEAVARALERASVVQATPPGWDVLLATGWRPSRPTRILTGGEALRPRQRDALTALGCRVWHAYGPSETTLCSTACEVTEDDSEETIPVGPPLPNTELSIVDEAGELRAVGEPGEVRIAGLGVALGYLNRPEATEARFVPDPVSDRFDYAYATGDMGHLLPDGSLVLAGRRDFQVKIRGQRVELGEVEAALRRDPQVAEAVVVAQGDDSVRLVAFATAAGGSVDADAALGRLRRSLPPHMVPWRLVVLDALPTTSHGKIDRRRLPVVTAEGHADEGPRDELEARLLSIWRAVLGAESAGVEDHFLELGGDSLAAVRIATRAGDERLGLLASDVLRHGTVAALAAHLRRKKEGPDSR